MVKHLGEFEKAQKIEDALFKVLKEGRILTRDLGGCATTSEFRDEIIKNL
jgi:isocitrate dehydrogenase (NAD+)